jgi:hypothetical protein
MRQFPVRIWIPGFVSPLRLLLLFGCIGKQAIQPNLCGVLVVCRLPLARNQCGLFWNVSSYGTALLVSFNFSPPLLSPSPGLTTLPDSNAKDVLLTVIADRISGNSLSNVLQNGFFFFVIACLVF